MKESITKLTNRDLLRGLEKLVCSERATTLQVLLHIVEVEQRRLFVPKGYSSMFSYLTKGLKYSEPSAQRRISSARVIAKYPRAHQLLEKDRVSLTALSLVSSILKDAKNGDEIIESIADKTRDEVRQIVSRHKPVSTTPRERIQLVNVAVKPIALKKEASKSLSLFSQVLNESPTYCRGERSVKSSETREPVEERFEFLFSIRSDCKKKFDLVQTLMSGKHPRGVSCEMMFERLLDEYLTRHCPKQKEERRLKRKSATEEKTELANENRSRYISVAIRDAVFVRDGGCCSYVSTDGIRCSARTMLHVDHVTPFGQGGNHEPSNLRLLCAVHNRHKAEQAYGVSHMQSFYQKRE